MGIAAPIYAAQKQASATRDAANLESQTAANTTAEMRRQFDLTRSDLAPYREVGVNALSNLSGIYGYKPSGGNAFATPSGAPGANGVDQSSGYQIMPNGAVRNAFVGGASQSGPGGPDYSNFFASPDYQFRKQQGMQGIERSFAARGMGKSGNALAALSEYNSGLAAGEFGNWFNRQAALAGVGQSATNTSGAFGQSTVNNIASVNQNAADAIGKYGVAGANARASGINNADQSTGSALGYFFGRRRK